MNPEIALCFQAMIDMWCALYGIPEPPGDLDLNKITGHFKLLAQRQRNHPTIAPREIGRMCSLVRPW